MEKIKDLMLHAAQGAGIPNQIEIPQDESIMLKFLMSGRLILPLAVMLTNMSHYKAFGKTLIHIDGGIIPDSTLPFGCRIDGDIDLESTTDPLGYILIATTSTFNVLKPYLLHCQIDTLATSWKERLETVSTGKKVLTIKDYADLPPLAPLEIT
ncbi:hypothetical protein [Photobacterium galatheae]|uniref:Uncharacterized protein n=1 Tax=Photobacterium galatheae TaxID=1654360 RepID=A0A066RHP9_9GAMM|nr:hypothetical protein [Photobacterium galatheae]KDM89980.1 hypothetical protein EA58_19745 [Photobacterium galatheae]MCM0149226.1 hypothetical protein [Photobacterium galatheae]